MHASGRRRLLVCAVCWQGAFPAARPPRRQLHDFSRCAGSPSGLAP